MFERKAIVVTTELKKWYKEMIMKTIEGGSIEDLSIEEFATMKSSMEAIDSTCELMLEQARMFDEMNGKLDILIQRGERA